MTYKDLKQVNPSDLDGYSVYDYELHLPLPTLSFILRETGIDLTLSTGTEQEAQSVVRFLAQTAINTIKEHVPSQARLNIEFLIAKSVEHRRAFITMVAYLVMATRAKGLDDLLADTSRVSNLVRIQAQANNLLQHKYDFVVEDVRGDY